MPKAFFTSTVVRTEPATVSSASPMRTVSPGPTFTSSWDWPAAPLLSPRAIGTDEQTALVRDDPRGRADKAGQTIPYAGIFVFPAPKPFGLEVKRLAWMHSYRRYLSLISCSFYDYDRSGFKSLVCILMAEDRFGLPVRIVLAIRVKIQRYW